MKTLIILLFLISGLAHAQSERDNFLRDYNSMMDDMQKGWNNQKTVYQKSYVDYYYPNYSYERPVYYTSWDYGYSIYRVFDQYNNNVGYYKYDYYYQRYVYYSY